MEIHLQAGYPDKVSFKRPKSEKKLPQVIESKTLW
jgi:hypothetical protein